MLFVGDGILPGVLQVGCHFQVNITSKLPQAEEKRSDLNIKFGALLAPSNLAAASRRGRENLREGVQSGQKDQDQRAMHRESLAAAVPIEDAGNIGIAISILRDWDKFAASPPKKMPEPDPPYIEGGGGSRALASRAVANPLGRCANV